MATEFTIEIVTPTTRVQIPLTLPDDWEDGGFVLVKESDRALVGVEVHHGEVVAGYWPDDEEWVDKIHVYL